MMRDDKLVRVAIKSGQPIERVLWVYGAILESAAEVDDGGRFDFCSGEAAYFLRADRADVDAVIAALEETGRICDGSVVAWGDRQYQSDRSGAERQARYRNRRKAGQVSTDGDSNGDAVVTSPSRHGDAPETETETETETEEERDLTVSSPPQGDGPALPVRIAFEEFCETARDCGLPVPKKLTASRQTSLRVRLREHGLDGWRLALANIRGSPFLLGDNDRGWKADFDFVLQAKSFNKLIEGGYNGTNRRNHEQDVEQAIAAGFAAYSERVASSGG